MLVINYSILACVTMGLILSSGLEMLAKNCLSYRFVSHLISSAASVVTHGSKQSCGPLGSCNSWYNTSSIQHILLLRNVNMGTFKHFTSQQPLRTYHPIIILRTGKSNKLTKCLPFWISFYFLWWSCKQGITYIDVQPKKQAIKYEWNLVLKDGQWPVTVTSWVTNKAFNICLTKI